MKYTTIVLMSLAFVLTLGRPTHAQFANVGSLEFPTSGSPDAQQSFLRGVAILHSFGWKQAIEQFQAAQHLDPDFAMAYWGETLCYNHPLFARAPDDDSPRAVLRRLGATREERLAKAPTDREKGFLEAVEILWGDGDYDDRRVAYMEAMGRLHDRYPDDPEVATFYAVALLSASRALGDQTLRLEMRAGAVALEVFGANPNHPGAPHYAIHAFDDPIHAPLALPAALRFAEIAPAVAHARHMPTHIFIQHGMWDLVSSHNQSSYDAARALWQPGDSVGATVHPLDWGQYGDLQRGDYAKARTWIERLEMVAEQSDGAARAASSLPRLRARYVVETEQWRTFPGHRRGLARGAVGDGSERGPHRPSGDGRARRGDAEGPCGGRRRATEGHAQGGGRAGPARRRRRRRSHAADGPGDRDRRRAPATERRSKPDQATL